MERRNRFRRVVAGILDLVAGHSIVLGVFVMIALFAVVFCNYSDFDSNASFVEPTPGQIVSRETPSAENRTTETFVDDVVKPPTVLPIQANAPLLGEVDEPLRGGFDSAAQAGPSAPAEPAPVAAVFPPAAPARLAEVTPQAGSAKPLPVQAGAARAKAASEWAKTGIRKVYYDKPVWRNGHWVLWHGAGRDN